MAKRKGYGQFCPVAKAAEIVAERWTPLVLRELVCGSRRFSEISQGVPLMSPSLLSRRLKELVDTGVLEKRPGDDRRGVEYHLTEAGRELKPIIEQLGLWGARWAPSQLDAEDLDPDLLMWDVRRRIDVGAIPRKSRTVIEFELAGVKRGMRRWWLVIDRDEVDVCLQDPGFEVNLHITSDVRTLIGIWTGQLEIRQAQREGRLRLDGPTTLVRSFPRWFSLSVFAGVERP